MGNLRMAAWGQLTKKLEGREGSILQGSLKQMRNFQKARMKPSTSLEPLKR